MPENNGLLIPVSGGSDSALCFWLCNQELGTRSKGIFIGDDLRSKDWFFSVGEVMLDEVEHEYPNPEVGRWAHFLSVALEEGRVLIGSRNRTEMVLGTFSHASRVASFLPLAGLWKSEIMELCNYVGIPDEILESSKRADPECGRPEALAEIPFKIVDAFVRSKLELSDASLVNLLTRDQHEYLEKVFTQNSYKPYLPLVGPEADISFSDVLEQAH